MNIQTATARTIKTIMRRHSDETLGRPAGSIGLGLYIARAVVQAHGGTIDVTSTKEETVFLVRMPRSEDLSDKDLFSGDQGPKAL